MSPEASAVPPKSAGNVGYHPKLQSRWCEVATPSGDEPTCTFVDTRQEDMLSKSLLIKQYQTVLILPISGKNL